MKEIILIRQGDSKILGEKCKASQPTVRRALRGETNHELAKLIRATAINMLGAVEVENNDKRIINH